MSDELTAIFPELIDSTMRNDYVSCEIKFEYARSYGLSAKGGSVHLIAGGAFAKGVEVVRKLVYRDGMELMDALVQGVLAAWTEYGAFEPGDKYVAKSAERVAYALVEYFTEYPMPTDRIQPYFRSNM